MSAAIADRLSWMWVSRPSVNTVIVAVRTEGVPGYRYWLNSGSGWQLHAEVHCEAGSVDWFAHRVTPQAAPAELAAWLDATVSEVRS